MAKKIKTSKRDIILEEAAKLFKERGYSGTSMRDLAEKVGMEAPSMYNHIRSKDEILEIICFHIANTYVSQLSKIESSEDSFIDKLKALIRLHIRMIIEDGAAVSVTNNDWKFLPDDKLKEFKDIRRGYEKRFAAIIEQGMAAGEFHDVNVSVALFTILSAVRWVELWYRPNRGVSAKALEETITTILLNGLVK
ncbi:TetR/AcrR family transcriptional regulator [Botryobacter ruber]|uniref:TetR/AcrR family transcriptional regulator n=1 Tax=Botryobacter ruber TaxID=2171629 RepID=UPI000E0B0FC7|nr:TetR/AcrR family transcriptional regulator [Botryobacter ruber]